MSTTGEQVELKSKHIAFTMCPNCIDETTLSIYAKYIYKVLCSFASSETNKVWPSQEKLAERVNCSVATIKRGIIELQNSKLLVKKTIRNGILKKNEYYLCTMFDPNFEKIIQDLQRIDANVNTGQLTQSLRKVSQSYRENTQNRKVSQSYRRVSQTYDLDPLDLNIEEEEERKESPKKSNLEILPPKDPEEKTTALTAPSGIFNSDSKLINFKNIEDKEGTIKLGQDWFDWACSKTAWKHGYKLDSFIDAIATIQRQGKFNLEPVRHLFEYIQTHAFWQNVAVSPCGLTKSKQAGVRKWETIMQQMMACKKYKGKLLDKRIEEEGGVSYF